MTILNIQETVRFIVACRNFRHRKYRNNQYCPDFTTYMETTIASLCAAWVTNIMTQRNAWSEEMITGRRQRKGVLYPHPSLLLTMLSSSGISLLSPPMFPACNASQLLASYFLSTGKVISPTKVRGVCIQQGQLRLLTKQTVLSARQVMIYHTKSTGKVQPYIQQYTSLSDWAVMKMYPHIVCEQISR